LQYLLTTLDDCRLWSLMGMRAQWSTSLSDLDFRRDFRWG